MMPGFEDLRDRDVPIRVITTSYMGVSDAPAIEWLAAMPNVQVRISYDTERTRLHAKAYLFPEALEEKLLCPFHYFGVADPVAISDDRFWRNGRYDEKELEKVYTSVHR